MQIFRSSSRDLFGTFGRPAAFCNFLSLLYMYNTILFVFFVCLHKTNNSQLVRVNSSPRSAVERTTDTVIRLRKVVTVC